jgi:hypothetical protein
MRAVSNPMGGMDNTIRSVVARENEAVMPNYKGKTMGRLSV